MLIRYLRLQVNRDKDLEDIMQDIFITIWKSVYGRSSVEVFGIARHKLLDWLRLQYRQNRLEGFGADEHLDYKEVIEVDFADQVVSEMT